MKKSWIIGFYIAAVLLIAGFSKAQALPVDRVTLDEGRQLLVIGGRFAQSCETTPRIEISKPWWQASMQSVQLRVVADQSSDTVCIQNDGRTYDVAVDLRTLNLPIGTTALVTVVNDDKNVFSMHRVQVASSLGSDFEGKVERSGLLVDLNHLQLNDGSIVNINSVIDLEPYLGRQVHVRGIEAAQLFSQPAELVVFDPIADSQRTGLLVTEISSGPLQ